MYFYIQVFFVVVLFLSNVAFCSSGCENECLLDSVLRRYQAQRVLVCCYACGHQSLYLFIYFLTFLAFIESSDAEKGHISPLPDTL